MRNIYLFAMQVGKHKRRVREQVFNELLQSPEPKKPADIISLMDKALEKEMSKPQLSPIPENKSTELDYKD
jgi:hypothetical protein